MIFCEMKQKLSVLPTPDRHQINDAIHRFVASGGEIQKLDPSPMNRAFDAGDGSGFHLERIRHRLAMESECYFHHSDFRFHFRHLFKVRREILSFWTLSKGSISSQFSVFS